MSRQVEIDFSIPARCRGCGFVWAGRDAIHAPSLDGCGCFWCGGDLIALDGEAVAGWPTGEPRGPRARAAERRRTLTKAMYGDGAAYMETR